MREFFHGWRRKAGCVTLLMACVLMSGWVRSRFYGDFVTPYIGENVAHYLASFDGGLKWIKTFNDPASGISGGIPLRYEFALGQLYDSENVLKPVCYGMKVQWQWRRQYLGLYFGEATFYGYRVSVWQIPYWSVTIPLTLLSAYLILWKPRKRTATR